VLHYLGVYFFLFNSGGIEIKVANNRAFSKIFSLIICTVIMLTCVSTAVADSGAGQKQLTKISITDGKVSIEGDQDQAAYVDDGTINQDGSSSIKYVLRKDGTPKKIVYKAKQTQIITPNPTDSVDSTDSNDNEIYTDSQQDFSVSQKENSVSINANQQQVAAQTGDGTINQKQSTKLVVKFTKDGEVKKVKVKMKQSQTVE